MIVKLKGFKKYKDHYLETFIIGGSVRKYLLRRGGGEGTEGIWRGHEIILADLGGPLNVLASGNSCQIQQNCLLVSSRPFKTLQVS